MGKLSASLVVSLTDRTAAGARNVKKSLSDIQRAERDLELARRNRRLTRVDRAEEALQIARDRDAHRLEQDRDRALAERQRRMGVFYSGVTFAATAASYAVGKSYAQFAEVERKIGRVALNADKGAEVVGPTLTKLQKVAQETALSFEDVSNGLETLVASGRSLDNSMAFLPSVAITAQASGAAISDIALSADAMAGSMRISAAEMQKAFDILVAGGKAGKFELKDMAQYLPSLLPAFSALGYEGTEGMQKIVAMLQVVRNQAGSSSEAATYLGNVFQKMYSEETAKKFKKFGVDLPKALDQAKKEGKDVLDVFLDLAQVATKGDLSKLTQLFTDAEMQKGVRALLMGRSDLERFTRALSNVDGSALRDFNQIADDSAAKIQRFWNLWEKLQVKLGSGAAGTVNPVLETFTDAIDDAEAVSRGLQGMDEEKRNWQARDFEKRYRQQNPDAWFWEVNRAYFDEVRKVGRGQAKTVFDTLNRADGARRGGERTAKEPSRGTYNPDKVKEVVADNGIESVVLPRWRPGSAEEKAQQKDEETRRKNDVQRRLMGYPGRGTYDVGGKGAYREWMLEESRKMTREQRRQRLRDVDPALLGMDGMFGVEMEEQQHRPPRQGGILDELDKSEPLNVSAAGPREVTLTGTPTVISQPSGVQHVQVTNPTPVLAPINVGGVTVHVTSAADPAAIGQLVGDEIGHRIKSELAGIQADTGWEIA